MACGFTGYEKDFSEECVPDKKLIKRIRQNITPQLAEDEIFPGKKYELAACIAEWQGLPAVAVGDLYLRAAWCCEDEDRREEEYYYRRQAIDYFVRALQQQEIPHEGIAVYTYLVGELYRRTGDSANAKLWLNRVADAVSDNGEKKWLSELARQQLDQPREFF
jgi:uncharacterized protein (DUF2225 family)